MENSNVKYTTDGKKVVVLGDLNSQEKIVQEIFVSNGVEIPSGENFIVKSLHDQPCISWKESEVQKIEEKYQKNKSEYDKLERELNDDKKLLQNKLSFLRGLNNHFYQSKLDLLIDFISGDVKYLVTESYGSIDIEEFNDTIVSKDGNRFDSIKLLSVFGRTDGDLAYKVNQYNDGSGSWKTIYPCKTKEEALVLLNDRFNEGLKKGLCSRTLKTAEKYNLEIPKNLMEEYKIKEKERILKEIENENVRLKKLQDELDKLK